MRTRRHSTLTGALPALTLLALPAAAMAAGPSATDPVVTVDGVRWTYGDLAITASATNHDGDRAALGASFASAGPVAP